jgi:uncharacterized protein
MRINVAQLLKQPVGRVRQYRIEEGGIRGKVRLLRINRGILVTAALEGSVTSVCSRCLEEFECPLSLDFEEEYFTSKDVSPEEADGFVIGEDHMLDLSEAIRQHTLLMLPMKPICREDCAGLCPVCGKNLNYGPCSCIQESSHSHWAPLQSLLSGEGVK